MKIVKFILNIIISFLLIFVILAMYATNIINNKVLEKKYITSKMDESEYYLQVSREIESGFENYIYQSGLPEDTIKDLFTQEDVKNDIALLIDKVYDFDDIEKLEEVEENFDEAKYEVNTDKLRSKLDERINEYLKSQNLKLNENGKNNINEFEELIVTEYKNNIKKFNTLYEKAHLGIIGINYIMEKIGNKLYIVTAVLILGLFVINIKNLLNGVNLFAISLLSAGIIVRLGIYLFETNVQIDNLMIVAVSVSNLAINILKELIYSAEEFSNIIIVTGIAGIVACAILNSSSNKNRKPVRRMK